MFRYILSSFFIIFLFSGCIHTQENVDYSAREYKGISKDAILNAAKRVIKLSDEDFTISSKRNSISVIRAIPKNKGFTVDININELEFNATTSDDLTTATLLIKKKDDIFSANQTILKGNVHELFWDRVDYILGLKKSWYSCTKYRLLTNFDGFFCDLKYNTNNYPSNEDIIKDITIQKPIFIVEDNINPTKIDLSSLEGILLPFKNLPIERNITLAELNTSGLFDLDKNKTNFNGIITSIDDTNSSNPDTLNLFIEDFNSTILDYIDKPLPNEMNSSINNQEIAILDYNQTTMNEMLHEVNDMIIKPTTVNDPPIQTQNENNQTILIIPTNHAIEQLAINDPQIIENNNNSKQNNNETFNNSSSPSNQNNLSDFAKRFLESDSKNYTINLAIAYTKEQSDSFIIKNQIQSNSFAIGFVNDTDNKYYIKIMHGIYKTKKEALQAIKNLSEELKVSKPTIESLKRKQDLFNKKGKDLSVR
jgi:hypothetical protein